MAYVIFTQPQYSFIVHITLTILSIIIQSDTIFLIRIHKAVFFIVAENAFKKLCIYTKRTYVYIHATHMWFHRNLWCTMAENFLYFGCSGFCAHIFRWSHMVWQRALFILCETHKTIMAKRKLSLVVFNESKRERERERDCERDRRSYNIAWKSMLPKVVFT